MIRRLEVCDEQNAAVQVTLAQRRLNGVTSTSAGRLFDGVSAMLGIRLASTFEGEASMALQFAAERAAARGSIPPEPDTDLLREENGFLYMTTDTLAEKLLRRRLDGEDPETLAWRFHDGLAARIAAACAAARDRTGVNTAALSGGVFQNTLLMDLTAARLRKLGFRLLTHRLIPPNDGGIALGQAVYAMEKLNESK